MAVEVPARAHPPAVAARVRPLSVLTGHAVRAFLRNPVAAFFTVAFPLAFLIIVSSIVGNEMTPEGTPPRCARTACWPASASRRCRPGPYWARG
jgi:hypothetical protein